MLSLLREQRSLVGKKHVGESQGIEPISKRVPVDTTKKGDPIGSPFFMAAAFSTVLFPTTPPRADWPTPRPRFFEERNREAMGQLRAPAFFQERGRTRWPALGRPFF